MIFFILSLYLTFQSNLAKKNQIKIPLKNMGTNKKDCNVANSFSVI